MQSLNGLTSITQPFFAACKTRRTCWQLDRCPTTTDQTILDIVNEAMLHSPSAFNSQSTRMLVLLGPEHEHLWMEIAKPILQVCAPKHVWPMTEKKLEGFADAHGTILLYECLETVSTMRRNFPLYSNYCSGWSEQTNGIHTFVVWTALAQAGFGATLQHYNPLIDLQVAARHSVPDTWQLKGQLVFGIASGMQKEKTFKPLEERIIVRGGKHMLI